MWDRKNGDVALSFGSGDLTWSYTINTNLSFLYVKRRERKLLQKNCPKQTTSNNFILPHCTAYERHFTSQYYTMMINDAWFDLYFSGRSVVTTGSKLSGAVCDAFQTHVWVSIVYILLICLPSVRMHPDMLHLALQSKCYKMLQRMIQIKFCLYWLLLSATKQAINCIFPNNQGAFDIRLIHQRVGYIKRPLSDGDICVLQAILRSHSSFFSMIRGSIKCLNEMNKNNNNNNNNKKKKKNTASRSTAVHTKKMVIPPSPFTIFTFLRDIPNGSWTQRFSCENKRWQTLDCVELPIHLTQFLGFFLCVFPLVV